MSENREGYTAEAVSLSERVVAWEADSLALMNRGNELFSEAREIIKLQRAEIERLRAGVPALPDQRVVLPVPYVPQWGKGADRAPGDCGPACVTMAIYYFTDQRPTVDQVSIAAGMEAGAHWTNYAQLQKACKAYGLIGRYKRPLTGELIRNEIDGGRPLIVLLKYDILSTPDDRNQDDFAGAHFVLVTGYQLGPGPHKPEGTIVFHDPDRLRGDAFGANREKSWSVFMNAMGSVSKTPGNSYNDQGMLLYVS